MQTKWLFAPILALLITTSPTAAADWKSHLAKKVVGRVAQEGIEEALEDVWQDAAFDVAAEAFDRHVGDAARAAAIGKTASEAVEAAMIAGDIASGLDNALDAAEAAKKVHKATKTLKKIRR
jgi:hypothetical protein